MRRARDASKIAPRDRYRYPTEYRALKTRCRGRPSEAKCTPHRDDPKIQTQMTIPCLTRSTLRGHALGNASRTGRTPPTTISFQKVREETPKIKISRVCPGDHKEKEASCCSETTDMPDMPLVTLGCINYRDTGRPSAHGSEAQTHLLQVARHQDEPRRQYARP
jgi:hypothetical protein